MLRAITHFDQVPLSVVIEIMEREIHKKAALAATRTEIREPVSTGSGRVNGVSERGQIMKSFSSVDIFRVDTQGVLWLESAGSVDEAKERIRLLAGKDSSEFVLLNHATGNKLTVTIDGNSASAAR